MALEPVEFKTAHQSALSWSRFTFCEGYVHFIDENRQLFNVSYPVHQGTPQFSVGNDAYVQLQVGRFFSAVSDMLVPSLSVRTWSI